MLPGFVTQWGLPASASTAALWSERRLVDDPVVHSNRRGTISFATARGPDSCTTQVFVNLDDSNSFLDDRGFAPFGVLSEASLAVLQRVYAGYAELPPIERPDQREMLSQGNAYLDGAFPNLR